MKEGESVKIYFIAKENGTFICGPFRKIEQAKEARENYTTPLFGRPVIVEKEYKKP